ncbi:MAG: hypothetical protein EB121_06950, partial [Alphaproteobacteria bacterium]|nr:hypothetical protein [Alphaproteobacteria bacterium]
MLKAMRHAAKTWLAYGLFILLILSFGIWGVGDMVKSNPQQRTAIEIGSLKIPVSELDKEFMNSFEQARQFFGTTFTREQAKQAGLLQQSVNNMIERELMTMKLKDYGFALGRNSALRELASVPGLNDGGKLNRAMFEQLLRQNNMTEDQLMAVLATERARDLFLDTLLVGTVVSAPAVDVLSASRSQRRHAEVLEVLHDRQQAPAAPADDVLKNFLETNATMFMRPERRDIDVLHVDGEQLKTTLTIGDDELKKSYDDNMAEFMTPATDTFLQVISSDEAVAKKIADGAKKLSSLNDYATAEKLDVQRMDGVSARDNLPPLVDALKKLDQGAISQPIQTAFGWH